MVLQDDIRIDCLVWTGSMDRFSSETSELPFGQLIGRFVGCQLKVGRLSIGGQQQIFVEEQPKLSDK